jgi:phasin family protein
MATAAKTARKATEAFDTVTNGASEAWRENMDRSTAAMSEVQAFGKENLDAIVASATATQKGFETISARTVAFSKQALENQVAHTKSLMTSKSVQEFVEKQTEFTKSYFEAYVAELTSMSDLISGVTKEAIAPINERMSAVGHLVQTTAQR